MPPRSFRTTASQTSGASPTRDTSATSRASPPVSSRWLWQVTQYRSSRARCADGADAVAVAAFSVADAAFPPAGCGRGPA